MSLNVIVDEFEKDSNVTKEAIANQLGSKENITLKTEIPFSFEVEIPSIMKDMTHFMGELYADVKTQQLVKKKVIDKDGKETEIEVLELAPLTYPIKASDGTVTQMTFGQRVTLRLEGGIVINEEYAVSHHRKGRLEIASAAGLLFRQQPQQPQKEDAISKMMRR
jgi:hypothetical protein